MARGRKATSVKKKLSMLCFGEPFTGKSTFASQFAYLKKEDDKPLNLLYIDCESGSIDNYLDEMERNGVNLDNIYIIYTQSLGEVLGYIEKIKNNDDFYELDEDGNETDVVLTDAYGEPFRPDAMVVDGASVLHMTTQQGLLEFSKRRARVKADNKGLVGEEKLVSVEGSSLEIKDWGNIQFKGQNLILSLLSTGIHHIVTCRETDEKKNIKDADGKITGIPTGKKIPSGFKDLDYNAHTVIRFYRDEDDNVVADVRKDRSGVHDKEIITDPSLLDWQVVLDGSKGKSNFVIKNDLDSAVTMEQDIYSREVMGRASKPLNATQMSAEVADDTKASDAEDPKDIKAQIRNISNTLDPVKKQDIKEKLSKAGLPNNWPRISEVDTLKEVLKLFEENC